MSATNPSSVVAVGVVMPALGIATVVLRFYTRRRMRNQILVDDWLLLPALVGLSMVEVCEARLTRRQLLTVGMGASLIAGEHILPSLFGSGSAERFQEFACMLLGILHPSLVTPTTRLSH